MNLASMLELLLFFQGKDCMARFYDVIEFKCTKDDLTTDWLKTPMLL